MKNIDTFEDTIDILTPLLMSNNRTVYETALDNIKTFSKYAPKKAFFALLTVLDRKCEDESHEKFLRDNTDDIISNHALKLSDVLGLLELSDVLGFMGALKLKFSDESLYELLPFLKVECPLCRADVIDVISAYTFHDDEKIIDALRPMLKDKSSVVRRSAIQALDELGAFCNKEGLEALNVLKEDEIYFVSETARHVLEFGRASKYLTKV